MVVVGGRIDRDRMRGGRWRLVDGGGEWEGCYLAQQQACVSESGGLEGRWRVAGLAVWNSSNSLYVPCWGGLPGCLLVWAVGGGRSRIGGGTEVPVDLSTVGSYRPPVDLGNNL